VAPPSQTHWQRASRSFTCTPLGLNPGLFWLRSQGPRMDIPVSHHPWGHWHSGPLPSPPLLYTFWYVGTINFPTPFFQFSTPPPPPPLPHTHTPNVIRESTCLHTSLVGLLAVCSNFLCCQTPACRLVDLIEDWQVGKQLFSWKNEVVNTPTNVANGNCQVELNIATSQWHYTAQYPLLRSSSTLTKWVYFLKESYFVFEEFELL
jgi:hypothetical protein